MFSKVVSTLLYVTGIIVLAIGVSIAAVIATHMPGYYVPTIIGLGLIIAGAVVQFRTREPFKIG